MSTKKTVKKVAKKVVRKPVAKKALKKAKRPVVAMPPVPQETRVAAQIVMHFGLTIENTFFNASSFQDFLLAMRAAPNELFMLDASTFLRPRDVSVVFYKGPVQPAMPS